MRFLTRAICLLTLTVAACSDTEMIDSLGGAPRPDSRVLRDDRGAPLLDQSHLFPDQAPAPDGVQPYTGEPVVFAHSAAELFKVDPKTLTVSLIGAFKWPGGAKDQMTDIAVDKEGRMIGISFTKVYAVNTKTAACTFLAKHDGDPYKGSYNGLSYISGQGAAAKEVLMVSRHTGALLQLNPATGKATPAGHLGGGLGTSGDLVSVRGLGTLATVKPVGSKGTDLLARLDPKTGKATVIGDTGFKDIWGLGYWKKKVYGFTDSGDFIFIDPKTGKGALVKAHKGNWWGAGVTTSAPVIK